MINVTLWKAVDGTLFNDCNSCKEYEVGLLRKAGELVKSRAIKTISGDNTGFFGVCGYDMDTYYTVDLKDTEVFDALNLLFPDSRKSLGENRWMEDTWVLVSQYDDDYDFWSYWGTYDECMKQCEKQVEEFFNAQKLAIGKENE